MFSDELTASIIIYSPPLSPEAGPPSPADPEVTQNSVDKISW